MKKIDFETVDRVAAKYSAGGGLRRARQVILDVLERMDRKGDREKLVEILLNGKGNNGLDLQKRILDFTDNEK
jgi:hypothetical protein